MPLISVTILLGGSGLSVQVKIRPVPYPQERLLLQLSFLPVPGSTPDWERLAPEVRTALAHSVARNFEAQDLEGWRQLVAGQMEENLKHPEAVVAALLARYGAGKDMISRFGEHVKAVNAERVRSMAVALLRGGRVEYLVP